MTEFFTANDGTKLAFTRKGEGRPVICLSGLTRNHTDFDYLAPKLEDVSLICLDYRGRGKSEWSGGKSYSIPNEASDVLDLLDHLGLAKAPILGTSRGGLIGMYLAAIAGDKVEGVCLNDIGPELALKGLAGIKDYIGRNPAAKTYEEAATFMATRMAGFANVPASRWMEEARKHYIETDTGLKINYDPELRELVVAPTPEVDLWPLFDALIGKPIGLIRGANSDLLTNETTAEMVRRRPDMVYCEVPDRGHIPFLDEDDALHVITTWLSEL